MSVTATSRSSNDEVERREVALLANETALSQSSTALLSFTEDASLRDRSNRLLGGDLNILDMA
jgi:hypothetical protein